MKVGRWQQIRVCSTSDGVSLSSSERWWIGDKAPATAPNEEAAIDGKRMCRFMSCRNSRGRDLLS
jgi:hypothetical protein